MRGHVDAEALAMCREGLLGRRAAARIRAHVSSCSRCAEADAELAALPALLALTGAAAPMPAELIARMDAVIAAEAAGRLAEAPQQVVPGVPAVSPADVTGPEVTGPEVTGPEVTGPEPGGHVPRGRPGVAARKVLALAAAVAVVAAGGGYLLSRLPSSSSGPSASSAAAPSTAGSPAVRGGGRVNATAGAGGLTVISSGTNYQPEKLVGQIAAVLARYGIQAPGHRVPAAINSASAHATSGSTESGSTAPTGQLLEPSRLAALSECVARIAAGQRPWMIDEARYSGRPATIIVLPATAQALTRVWVVGPACSASRSDVIAHTALPGSG
jgi:hypothetical protein